MKIYFQFVTAIYVKLKSFCDQMMCMWKQQQGIPWNAVWGNWYRSPWNTV